MGLWLRTRSRSVFFYHVPRGMQPSGSGEASSVLSPRPAGNIIQVRITAEKTTYCRMRPLHHIVPARRAAGNSRAAHAVFCCTARGREPMAEKKDTEASIPQDAAESGGEKSQTPRVIVRSHKKSTLGSQSGRIKTRKGALTAQEESLRKTPSTVSAKTSTVRPLIHGILQAVDDVPGRQSASAGNNTSRASSKPTATPRTGAGPRPHPRVSRFPALRRMTARSSPPKTGPKPPQRMKFPPDLRKRPRLKKLPSLPPLRQVKPPERKPLWRPGNPM